MTTHSRNLASRVAGRMACTLALSIAGLLSAAGCQSPKTNTASGWSSPSSASSAATSNKSSWSLFREEPKPPQTASDFVGMKRPE